MPAIPAEAAYHVTKHVTYAMMLKHLEGVAGPVFLRSLFSPHVPARPLPRHCVSCSSLLTRTACSGKGDVRATAIQCSLNF